jgi:hypothetical protein
MKTRKRPGHFEHGFFVPDKEPKSMGRLAQLSKVRRKRTDSEAVRTWRESDERHSP